MKIEVLVRDRVVVSRVWERNRSLYLLRQNRVE
jgi:hypothetical protein